MTSAGIAAGSGVVQRETMKAGAAKSVIGTGAAVALAVVALWRLAPPGRPRTTEAPGERRPTSPPASSASIAASEEPPAESALETYKRLREDALLRERYPDIIPRLAAWQYARFKELMRRHAGLLPSRDRGLADGTYKSYTAAQNELGTRLDEIDREVTALLGPEMFEAYRDDNRLIAIGRELLVRGIIIGSRAEPLTAEQLGRLKYAYLDAYKILNAEDAIFFDPSVFQYTSGQYFSNGLKRSRVYRAVLLDAKDYLSAAQLAELERQLQLQNRMNSAAMFTGPNKID
jgi:hypothetical protein